MSEGGDNQALADYILGKLPEADEARLEDEYLADSSLQEQLLLIEDVLVDAYAQGHLSKDDRAQLEARFLASPRGRRKLELTNSLVGLAAEQSSRETQAKRAEQGAALQPISARGFSFRWALASTALLFVLASSWLFRGKLLHRSTAERAQTQTQGIDRPLPPSAGGQTGPTSSPVVVSIFLEPALRNVDRVERAAIPRGAQEINFQLDVRTGMHNSYRLTLLNTSDQVKWSGSGLKTRPTHSGKVIDLRLAVSLFENGGYTLLLSPNESGARPIAEYEFVVEKP